MRAITVCVDLDDVLRITLPRQRPHFSEMMIVTTERDTATQALARQYDCWCYVTDAFYRDGAYFRKWLALEEGLDAFGRFGWLTLLDVDIIWPKQLPAFPMEIGTLYTPLRRMFLDVTQPIPPEEAWTNYSLHPNYAEWAGYSMTLHADDPHLPPPPWHETDWLTAGGADSFLQARWAPACKIRPPFEVLHIGPAGTNWLGRVSRRTDGTMPEGGEEKTRLLRNLIARRGVGPDRFREEKIRGT